MGIGDESTAGSRNFESCHSFYTPHRILELQSHQFNQQPLHNHGEITSILASESQREQPCHPSIGFPEVAVQYVTLINWIIIGTEMPRTIAPTLL